MKCKRIYAGICAGLFAATLSYGQSNTRGISSDTMASGMMTNNNSGNRVLIIPFNPSMCMSGIDKDVNAATHLDYKQITSAFRRQLDMAMYRELSKDYTPISILQGRYRNDSVLNYIYGSTGYKYDLAPGTTPDIGATEGSKNKKGLYIHKGELQVPVDYSKRFMNVSISNPHLLADLYEKYHTTAFVFINELDIKNVKNPAQNLSDPTYRREVTVQYCILNKKGKSIAKGLVKTYFPYRENNPRVIGGKYFSLIAFKIVTNYRQGLTIDKLSEQRKKQQVRKESNTMAPH